MNSIDKLKLLAGLPITMSDFTCSIYPATLKEIASLGVNEYFKYVNLLTIKEDEILKIVKEKIDPFDFLFINSVYKETFKEEFVKALYFFIKDEILFLSDVEAIVIGKFEEGRMLTKENFFEFQKIISAQNFIQEEIVKYTGEDEAAKMIKAKLEKSREKIEKSKNKREDKLIEMADLVGSLTINSSLDIVNVWGISYYTFNDQFKRMRILEQYSTGLQSIMAGADPKKIKLQDWIQSIQ